MLIHVPLDYVLDNPFQRRQDYGDVASLAADIKARGLLQTPIGRLIFDHGEVITGAAAISACRRIEADGFPAGLRVQLAFGHRRLRAHRHLAESSGHEFQEMPVHIDDLDDDAMLDAVWSENQHRSDINPIEQAELLAEKLERARAAGGNQQTVAADWRLDRSTVANKLRLLDLPADVQTAVRERRISERQALALLPVVELESKLNGAAVKWADGKKPAPYGTPIAPADFLAHVVGQPAAATSDTIRDYSRRVADHAGRPLSDDLAKFDAGEDERIVQPTCAGCPRRHNQHCLQPACADAKWALYKAHIPQLAADHAGLPWCDDPAAFPDDYSEAKQLRALYESGRRGRLVVGWVDQGLRRGWLTGQSGIYKGIDAIRADWRNGLLLGRLPQAQPQAEADESAMPPLQEWFAIREKIRDARRARVHQALTDAVDRLLDDRAEALRPLLYLAGRRSYVYSYDPDQSVAVALHLLVGPADQYYTATPFDSWADLFTAIGLDPALIDPTDPADALREQATNALINWYDDRRQTSSRSDASVALGHAINAFEAAGITAADDETDLAGLARWLTIARADAVAVINGGKPA